MQIVCLSMGIKEICLIKFINIFMKEVGIAALLLLLHDFTSDVSVIIPYTYMNII